MNKLLLILFVVLSAFSCTNQDVITEIVENAVSQNTLQIEAMNGEIKNPVTIKGKDGATYYCGPGDWRSGFYPGSMWYMYELTGDEKWLPIAKAQTAAIERAKTLTSHHDIGFIIECSFGNGLRLTGNDSYKDVIHTAAKSLVTRFRPNVGAIQSWNVTGGWQAKRGWEVPVIIDNMMNLELLFNATILTGDSTFYKVAVSHADRTLAEQFRPDGSCFHVVDYDLKTGDVRNRHTAQGYSHESAWSRGQAWAIYGYAVTYRFTKDKRYLDQAIKSFEFMKNHPVMPEDLIPYWDMDAPNIPDELRDASAAAIIASALYELSTYVDNGSDYKNYADRMMETLASSEYTAPVGDNNYFILDHSVGSIPHGGEIDEPLNYADYYYLEAVKRKRDIENKTL